MGALVIDKKKYAWVLAKVLPRVITTHQEHERMLAEVEKLMDKGEHRTAEEDAALDLMVRLIKDYEEGHYPLPDPSPHDRARSEREALIKKVIHEEMPIVA